MISTMTLTVSTHAGPQGDLEVCFDHRDAFDGRAWFQWAVDVRTDNRGSRERVAYGHELSVPREANGSPVAALAALCSFLDSDGESCQVRGATNPDDYATNWRAAEWANALDGELALIAEQLTGEEA